MANYPGSLDNTTTLPTGRSDGTAMATNHASDHDTLAAVAVLLETKLGTGTGAAPLLGQRLTGTVSGISEWATSAGPPNTITALGPTQITSSQRYVLLDASNNNVTVTLPDITTLTPGMTWRVLRLDATANVITVNPFSAGQTIGLPAATTVSLPLQGDALYLTVRGAVWDSF